MTPIAIMVALNLALGAGFLSMAPVSAQSDSAEGSAQISYKTAYPKASADSDNSVTVQSEHHLYRPGDTVMIMGSVLSEIREETDRHRNRKTDGRGRGHGGGAAGAGGRQRRILGRLKAGS